MKRQFSKLRRSTLGGLAVALSLLGAVTPALGEPGESPGAEMRQEAQARAAHERSVRAQREQVNAQRNAERADQLQRQSNAAFAANNHQAGIRLANESLEVEKLPADRAWDNAGVSIHEGAGRGPNSDGPHGEPRGNNDTNESDGVHVGDRVAYPL